MDWKTRRGVTRCVSMSTKNHSGDKRGGFVPLDDIAGAVERPNGRALTPAAPQALHHFTRLDQIDQLVEASEADADLGFMARLLALCSLPRTNPGDQKEYIRRNGPYTLGRGAVRRRLRNQMQRLFRSHVELVYEDAHGSRFVNSAIADSGEFWWDAKHPDQPALWESKIELGEKFFHEVITNPIPLDLHILKAVKRSPLGLDLYLWLTYRTFALKRPLRLTWPLLYRQFGADPAKAGDARTVDPPWRERSPRRRKPSLMSALHASRGPWRRPPPATPSAP